MFLFALCAVLFSQEPVSIDEIQYPLDVPFSLASSIEDTQQQKELYHFLVESYTKQGLLDRAFQVVSSLPKSMIILSKPLYKTLFLTYYKHTSANETLSLVKSIDSTIKPYVIEACFQYSFQHFDIDDSILFFNAIESPIISSRLSNLLVTYFVTQNDLNKALMYHDLIKLPAEKEKSLATLAILYTKSGDITKINRSLSDISNTQHKHTLLLNVVTTLLDLNEHKTALNFLEQLKNSPVYEKALTQVIRHKIDTDNFSEAISLAQSLETDFYKHDVMILLGVGFGRSGNLKAINELMVNLESDDLKHQFIKDVSVSLATHHFIQESFDLSKKLPTQNQQDHFLNLIHAFSNHDDFRFILLLIKQINNYEIINKTLAGYAIQLASVNKHDEAINTIQSITDVSIKDDCVLTILKSNKTMTLYPSYQALSSPYVRLSYISYLSNYISDALSAHDLLDFMDSSLNPKRLKPSDRLQYHLERGILYAYIQEPKKAIASSKRARKLIRKLKQHVSLSMLRDYVYLESLLDRPNQALKVLKKQKKYYYPTDILYLFDQLYDSPNQSIKLLQSFTKDFQK